jgi:hypothetical protein
MMTTIKERKAIESRKNQADIFVFDLANRTAKHEDDETNEGLYVARRTLNYLIQEAKRIMGRDYEERTLTQAERDEIRWAKEEDEEDIE